MTERDEIFRDIQTVLSGRPEREIIAALLTSLVTAIGVASKDLKHAESVVDAIPIELKPILRDNWDAYRKHGAKATAKANMIRNMAEIK